MIFLLVDVKSQLTSKRNRMSHGWRMNAFVSAGHNEVPAQIPYLVAVADEKAAKRKVARTARISVSQVETVSELDAEDLADVGLEAGDITKISIPRKLGIEEMVQYGLAKVTLQREHEEDEPAIALKITTRNKRVYNFTFVFDKAEKFVLDLNLLLRK